MAETDIEQLLQLARRLEIDPWDLRAERDQTGEFYCRVGRSATDPGRDLAAGYHIDEAHRTVELISIRVGPDSLTLKRQRVRQLVASQRESD